MATSAMLGVSNEDNEVELSLELSIGRGYKRAKPENSRSTSLCVKDRAGVAEKMFGGETGVDFHSKREIQALRRQEAKKKREEKMKKTTNCVTMEARVRDVDEDVRNRKREKIENVVVGNRIGGIGDLNLALKTGSCAIDPSMQLRNCGMLYNSDQVKRCWPHVAGEVKQAEVKVSIPADSRLYQRNFVLNEDGTDHGSAGCSSSAVSDYQSSPGQQGPAGCGSSSNSSHTAKPKQNLNTNSPTQYSEHATASSSSAPKIKSNEPVCRSVSVSVPIPNHPKDNTIEAGKAQIENAKEIVSLPQMPCVSATGNGPNGKTINGLLYRYTKTEVTIVCVCHGTSFSPAGFVEHAGGIDIAHPLKHITVVPSGL